MGCVSSAWRSKGDFSLDGEKNGNVARFLNHSCNPNLCTRKVYRGGICPEICFFASRNIRAGDELTWNYVQRFFYYILVNLLSVCLFECDFD